ncbi:MAG: STAS-like domain-containing protein [Deltaproteobacteria bacterium]|nr:STAS-like domain-containing protein [Deltaproteobacteria bacterium]
MKINITELCGNNSVTRADGDKVNKLLMELWDKTDVFEVDFNNRLIASVSFIDEAFGRLALSHPKRELQKKLVFKNMADYDRNLLNDLLSSHYRQIKESSGGRPMEHHLPPLN